tara:strand:+ start:96 stop:317 length:222 start_codon:yes stop_codon:yes gene_type:complete
MNKYSVRWSKTYHASGNVVVKAHSLADAEETVREQIGDYEGSMQYDADNDMVEAYKIPKSKSYPVSAAIRDRS